MFQFLDLSLSTTDVYEEVLRRVKAGDKFLDLGCCLGQEIRQLVHDGAPSTNTYGSDLWEGLMEVGYELFRDRERLQTTFIAADVFDDASALVGALAGRVDIVYTGAFFHLFGLEEQERAAMRVVQLLAPRSGSLVVGRQSGSEEAGEFSSSRAGDKRGGGRKHFRHNPQSWKELWDRVGEKTGTKWEVEADVRTREYTLAAELEGKSEAIRQKMTGKGLRFVVRRL